MSVNNKRRSRIAIHRSFLLLLLFSAFALSSCNDEDALDIISKPNELSNQENRYVNSWIQENMEYWYLWNEDLPSDVDKGLAPDEYFSALLNEDDRFSWIQDNYQELVNSLEGINKEAGFEYVLYRENNSSENVVAQVLYVKPSSPASEAGLKRGDLITRINGKTMTTANYREVIKELKENHTLVYKPLVVEEERFENELSVTLNTVQYAENPNHLKKVITAKERKIGYYVYNFFASGDGNTFDNEMDDIFNEFKNDGITDLVLDLRFNSGGSEISAKNLGSLVGAGISSSAVFFKREYNSLVTDDILKAPSLGQGFLFSKYADKAANVGNMLTGKRVYILTSSRTASASELIINSLRPYMEVFIIGDVTYGKNVGSISIYEDDDPKNKWGLQPIVVKVANSEGFSDYGDGFTPNIENKDNSLYIYPLGDTREALLAEAIAQITGENTGGRISVEGKSLGREIIGHSLDEKRRSFRLIMDKESMPAKVLTQE